MCVIQERPSKRICGADVPSCLHVVLKTRSKVDVHEEGRQAGSQRFPGSLIIRQPQIAPDDVLQQAHAGIFRQHLNHVVQHGTDSKEAFCCGANVIQASLSKCAQCVTFMYFAGVIEE